MCDIRLFRSAKMDYDWVDEHSEMLSEWEAQSQYDMDFLVEKRRLSSAMEEIRMFLHVNGIRDELREKSYNQ